jgi:peroxiredoxin Q/BCP
LGTEKDLKKNNADILILMLIGVVILLMVVNIGLFLRMNQLQVQVIQALQPLQRPYGLSPGTEAPLFALPDTNGTVISLQAFRGKRVLLVFSSIACSACREMYPELKEFQSNPGGISILMVSQASEEENLQLVQNHGFEFPILQLMNDIKNDYKIPGTPCAYLIDEKGVITSSFLGLDQLEEYLTKKED